MRSTGRCVTLWVSLWAGPVLAAAGPQPKIHVDKHEHQFGKIWSDNDVEHEFEVKNVGDAPLRIKRVRTSCGCLPVKAKPQTLAPGASTKIKVKLNTRNLHGKVRKSVHIESDDPKRPRQPLTFSGEIRRSITMVPVMARFPRLDRHAPSTLVLTVTNNRPGPMALRDPTSSAQNVSADVTEIEKGKKYKVTLTARPPYTGPTLNGKVTFKTGTVWHPVHTIGFFGRPPAAIDIEPTRTINLGRLAVDKSYTQTVRIVSTDAKPFDITEVTCTNWRIVPIVREVSEKKVYEVQITARPPYAWGVNRGYVKFKTRPGLATGLTVHVHGELPRPVKVNPPSLLFRDLAVDKGGQDTVTLVVDDSAHVKLSSPRSTLPNVTAKLDTLVEGKRYRLTATAVPPLEFGRLEGQIVIDTTYPGMKTLTVPIQSFPVRLALPAVSVVPDPVLTLPATGASTKPAVGQFAVRANDGKKVHVTKVEVTHSQIVTSIRPFEGAEDTLTFIRVTVPAAAKINPAGETITIHTDRKGFSRLTRRIARKTSPGAAANR